LQKWGTFVAGQPLNTTEFHSHTRIKRTYSRMANANTSTHTHTHFEETTFEYELTKLKKRGIATPD